MVLYDRFKLSVGSTKETSNKLAYTMDKNQYRAMIKQGKIQANDNFTNEAQNKFKAAWTVIKKEDILDKPRFDNLIGSEYFNDYFVTCTSQSNSMFPSSEHVALDLLDKYLDRGNFSGDTFKLRCITNNDVLFCVS